MVLTNNALSKVLGGASTKSWGLGIILTAIGTFLIGIIDGFIRPLPCNS